MGLPLMFDLTSLDHVGSTSLPITQIPKSRHVCYSQTKGKLMSSGHQSTYCIYEMGNTGLMYMTVTLLRTKGNETHWGTCPNYL